MRPDLSEFSYGYALTEDLIQWAGTPLTAAPLFPTLLQEGQSGGGWDVQLPFQGVPLFLQFKLSDFMISSQTIRNQQGLFQPPFYRMHLRPLRLSQQHRMLLDLESAGVTNANNLVFYVRTGFLHGNRPQRCYTLSREVAKRSVFFRPSAIGNLPMQRSSRDIPGCNFSTPRGYSISSLTSGERSGDYLDLLAEEISARLDGHGLRLDDQLPDLAARISHVLQSYVDWIEQGEMEKL